MNNFDDDRSSGIVAGYVLLAMLTTPIVLTLLFVILKALNVISWNWFWVFSPITIPAIIILFVLIVTSAEAILNNDYDRFI